MNEDWRSPSEIIAGTIKKSTELRGCFADILASHIRASLRSHGYEIVKIKRKDQP